MSELFSADKKDPLAKMMQRCKDFRHEDDVTKTTTYMGIFFSYSVGLRNGIYRKDMSAIEHLELWKVYQDNWCEHKPSITVSVKEEEWMEVGAWVYNNFEDMSGVSFLPL